ncbi:MAG: hypothetical protein LR015_11100 [Verrucomicrobia bacterium]|nr:hypothetical protein [Verrucomicrobiota bacterium]
MCVSPSLGPGPEGQGEIVFQHGQLLKVLELENYTVRTVEVRIPGALPIKRTQTVDASRTINQRGLSPTGARVLLEARGDLWSLPARHGSARNLTRTSGVAERQPAWSPDGQWILFSGDRSGEYQLTLMRADGSGDPIELTDEPGNFYYTPLWAPDSKHFAVNDKAQRIWIGVIPAEGEQPEPLTLVDSDPSWPTLSADWSPDSKWLVYSIGESTRQHRLLTRSLWAFSVDTGERKQLTSGMFSVWSPTFDRKGEFLYYISNADFTDPQYEDVGSTFVYHNTGRIMVVPLRTDLKVPFHPRSDEEKGATAAPASPKKNGKEEEKQDAAAEEDSEEPEAQETTEDEGEEPEEKTTGEEPAETAPAADPKEAPKPAMEFVWENFEQRSLPAPVARGTFSGIAVNDRGHLVYMRMRSNRWGSGGDLVVLDLSAENPREASILENINILRCPQTAKKYWLSAIAA